MRTEGEIRLVDPALIHDTGLPDRLECDEAADAALLDSLVDCGQQVPVLLRPFPDHPGHYELVAGRRRVRMLAALGQPVRAEVRALDDTARALAQGLGNALHQRLSFVERARLAGAMAERGILRVTIGQALSVTLTEVGRLLRVGLSLPADLLEEIGPAPGIGRDRWLALARAMGDPEARRRVDVRLMALQGLPSDERFWQVLAWAEGRRSPSARGRGPGKPTRKVLSGNGFLIGRVKQEDKAVSLSVPRDAAPGFADWLDAEGDTLLREIYARWLETRGAAAQTPPAPQEPEAEAEEDGAEDTAPSGALPAPAQTQAPDPRVHAPDPSRARRRRRR